VIRSRARCELGYGRRANEDSLTASQLNPSATAPDVRAAIAALRRDGHRVSSSRRQVLEALYAANAPVTADEIAGGLGGRLPHCDDASVYRTLELLERMGLVRHVHLGHGPGRYAPASGAERDYFVCERCHEVRAADPRALEPVREAIARAFGWRVRFSHFPIAGLCPRCAEEAACSD
jgi:Fur family transcriptional regulator, ferric uptake regulator